MFWYRLGRTPVWLTQSDCVMFVESYTRELHSLSLNKSVGANGTPSISIPGQIKCNPLQSDTRENWNVETSCRWPFSRPSFRWQNIQLTSWFIQLAVIQTRRACVTVSRIARIYPYYCIFIVNAFICCAAARAVNMRVRLTGEKRPRNNRVKTFCFVCANPQSVSQSACLRHICARPQSNTCACNLVSTKTHSLHRPHSFYSRYFTPLNLRSQRVHLFLFNTLLNNYAH